MSEKHRLSTLKMCVAGNDRIAKTFGDVEDRGLQIADKPVDLFYLLAQPESKRSSHLIVPAAAGVELAARVADRLDEL